MSDEDVLDDAANALTLAEMFANALENAQQANGSAEVVILMGINGDMVSYSNTSPEMAVFLAETYSVHQVLSAFNMPVEGDDE